MDVKFRCPNCGSVGLAALKYVGHLVPCPKCNKGVLIPRTASIVAAAEPDDELAGGDIEGARMDADNAENLRTNCRIVLRLSYIAFFSTVGTSALVATFGTWAEFVMSLFVVLTALSWLSMTLIFVYAGHCLADIHSHFRLSRGTS